MLMENKLKIMIAFLFWYRFIVCEIYLKVAKKSANIYRKEDCRSFKASSYLINIERQIISGRYPFEERIVCYKMA